MRLEISLDLMENLSLDAQKDHYIKIFLETMKSVFARIMRYSRQEQTRFTCFLAAFFPCWNSEYKM